MESISYIGQFFQKNFTRLCQTFLRRILTAQTPRGRGAGGKIRRFLRWFQSPVSNAAERDKVETVTS
jgi:hypothetical protein